MSQLNARIANFLERFLSHPLGWFALASILLHILRQPTQLFAPQLWAEDGVAFLREDFNLGPSVLFKNYGGYLHLWPRLGALAFGYLPMLWFPLATKLFALLTHALLLLALASPRFPGDRAQKAAMMLIIGLVPHAGEAYLCMCNSNSFAVLILLVMCASERPLSVRGRGLETVALFVLACTGPYVLFLLPILLAYWAFCIRPFRAYLWRIAALAAGFAVQVSQFSLATRERQDIYPSVDVWAEAIQRSLKGLIFAKLPFPQPLAWGAAIVVLLALVLCFEKPCREVLGRRARAEGSARIAILLVIAATANLAASMYFARVYLEVLGPFLGAPRYYFPTYILILWGLILGWRWTARSSLRRNLVVISVLCSLCNFSSSMPYRNLDWRGQVENFERTGKATMQILPPGWSFELDKTKAWRAPR